MQTMREIILLLQVVIRIGVICRVVICLLKICANNDDGGVGENKQKIKNAIIFLIMSECVWIVKDVVFSYYSINIDL